jgi:hypothetical protein
MQNKFALVEYHHNSKFSNKGKLLGSRYLKGSREKIVIVFNNFLFGVGQ